MESNKVIRMRHIRKAGLCSRGLRAFATERGIDWDDFLENGISVEVVRGWNDAIGNKVADIAEADEDLNNG